MSISLSGIPDDVVRQLADRLMGTCDSLEHALDMMDVRVPDEFTIEDVITDLEVISVERCPYCQWWMESCDIVDDDLNVVGCSSCRPALQEDDDCDDR